MRRVGESTRVLMLWLYSTIGPRMSRNRVGRPGGDGRGRETLIWTHYSFHRAMAIIIYATSHPV